MKVEESGRWYLVSQGDHRWRFLKSPYDGKMDMVGSPPTSDFVQDRKAWDALNEYLAA